ncbi:MAG: class I SAM-dependent methyltransferase [Nitrospirota bacterium]|nr:class I SAM-dependent methyltransferase [Nitrospirota bacterium]
MDQQNQTLNYFSTHADDWQTKATQADYSVIDNRHAAVLTVIEQHNQVKRFLDVGCGTGQLVIAVAKLGIKASGLDFSREMIVKCESNKLHAQVDAEFQCGSFFDISLPDDTFDVISAQGFIEYISLEQMDIFLSNCVKTLVPGGSLALGSRNRLFNLHSLNCFTELEMELGTVKSLLSESIVLQGSASQEEAIRRLTQLERTYPQPELHPITGIKVDTRYQFSPADLMARMRKHGLRPRAIYPVHFHGLPSAVIRDEDMAPLHKQLAQLVSGQKITDCRYVPYSSSFVLEAQR